MSRVSLLFVSVTLMRYIAVGWARASARSMRGIASEKRVV